MYEIASKAAWVTHDHRLPQAIANVPSKSDSSSAPAIRGKGAAEQVAFLEKLACVLRVHAHVNVSIDCTKMGTALEW